MILYFVALFLLLGWIRSQRGRIDVEELLSYIVFILAAVAAAIFKPQLLWFFALLVAPFALALLFDAIRSLREWIGRQSPCAHGVRAGASGRCEKCEGEAIKRQAELDAKYADENQERERRRAIEADARRLRETEIERLSNAWMGHAKSYFEMEPQQFESAIAELFRKLGYKVKQTPFSNDGGKDAIASKDGKKFLIECKRYGETNSIGRRDLQILVAAIQDEKADGGFYVNTGVFSKTAEEYAKKHHITLYDRPRFPLLVNRAYPQSVDFSQANVMCPECGSVISMPIEEFPATGNCPNGHPITGTINRQDVGIFSSTSNGFLRCEQCGAAMRLVKGKQGILWGCSRYPRCRSTKPLTYKSG